MTAYAAGGRRISRPSAVVALLAALLAAIVLVLASQRDFANASAVLASDSDNLRRIHAAVLAQDAAGQPWPNLRLTVLRAEPGQVALVDAFADAVGDRSVFVSPADRIPPHDKAARATGHRRYVDLEGESYMPSPWLCDSPATSLRAVPAVRQFGPADTPLYSGRAAFHRDADGEAVRLNVFLDGAVVIEPDRYRP